MSDGEDRPEPDRIDGAPHPRMAGRVVGHARAVAEVDAAMAGAMPHAWLLSGPKGVGKATFAWTFARRLLGADADPQVAARVEALSEPRLALVRRAWDDRAKRLRTQITVDEIRKLRDFLGLSAPDGGRRVILIDAADEMNPAASNAVLKLLEEPPPKTVFLVICHNPAGLLPTIRSRCRPLRFDPLPPEDLGAALAGLGIESPDGAAAITALAGGSVGRAVGLIEGDGLGLYATLIALLAGCPNLDRSAALAFANAASARGAEAKRDMVFALIETALARLARAGTGAAGTTPVSPAEAETFARLAPGPAAARAWAELAQTVTARAAHALGVNLDPSGVILDILFKINETAGRVARP
ncbi:MAG: DNA polymerase III subunit delta' [Paracoccaceae bacterium]|nr:DNA polymerase III subunit delta' [Paracoccaceae bacterium]